MSEPVQLSAFEQSVLQTQQKLLNYSERQTNALERIAEAIDLLCRIQSSGDRS